MEFSHREKTLIDFLISFYKDKVLIIRDIINQDTPLSLRLLDWLVTNYSKKYNVIYQLTDKRGNIFYFNIYLDYKNQLKAYSKKFFDPFCRQKRILININTLNWKYFNSKTDRIDNNNIVTTIGQLNFFKWFLENKIYEYAINNIKLIDMDMNNTMMLKNKDKRTVLSPCAVKGVFTNDHKITVSFTS